MIFENFQIVDENVFGDYLRGSERSIMKLMRMSTVLGNLGLTEQLWTKEYLTFNDGELAA